MKKSASSLISFLFFILLCVLLISASSAKKPKCHPKDQKSMEQIAASLGINFTGDCCEVPLIIVKCTYIPPYNRVTHFQVDGTNISGQISGAIGDLSYLEVFVINSAPNVAGNIPSTVAKLSKLNLIMIDGTSISGPIPTFHENLTSITDLYLLNNAFTGSIPSELPIWFPNLKKLWLQNNKLTGTIPESLGNLRSDIDLIYLSNNSLTGPIPKSLGNLNPNHIDLSGNNFYGDASALFSENKTIMYLYLDRNNFKFDMSKVNVSRSLIVLTLSYNNIFGSLPWEMTQVQRLSILDVSHNMLCGEIPQGGMLQAFRSTSYSHNKCLCGDPLPPCV